MLIILHSEQQYAEIYVVLYYNCYSYNNYNNTTFVQRPEVRGCRGASGFRLRLSEQVGFEVFLKAGKVRQARMSEGSEFQVVAATTEKLIEMIPL